MPMIGTDLPITQNEFARRVGVSPGRVRQWIVEKKIAGASVVGTGKGAEIVQSIATAQLRRNRPAPAAVQD